MKQVLIVGAGGIANKHAGAISAIPEIKVIGVCDIIIEKAQAVAEKLGAHPYSSLDDAIAQSSPDYVVLLTPRGVRETIVDRCIAESLPILMEKPPCHNLSTGRRILEKIESSGLIHSVAFMHRWNDTLNTVLQKLGSQQVRTVNISYQSNFGTKPCWDTYPDPYLVERSGGLVGDQGIHYIDISRYITKSEVRNLLATGTNQLLPVAKEVTTRDTASWIMEMENGAIVTHNHTWCAPEWGCKIELVTADAIVYIDMFKGIASGIIQGERFEYKRTKNEFETQHRGFLSAVEKRDMSIVRSPYRDALETFRVAAEINSLLYGSAPELT
jgi:predicted dehydrogenase